ncbi:hypothetical protein, partial [Lactiplantibacillus plantarum]|uniref:hypothetical protein n=1 Tax=Lactiplantibacillus plantarum TaxID=1590 RepID=UPI00237FECBF
LNKAFILYRRFGMFYMIGYIFAGLILVIIASFGVVAAIETLREKRDTRPDIITNGNIKIKIDDGPTKYYRVDEVITNLNDKGSNEYQNDIKELVLHQLTDEDVAMKLLA